MILNTGRMNSDESGWDTRRNRGREEEEQEVLITKGKLTGGTVAYKDAHSQESPDMANRIRRGYYTTHQDGIL